MKMIEIELFLYNNFEAWQLAIGFFLVFLSIELITRAVAPILSKTIRDLDDKKKADFAERIPSTVHAILLFQGAVRVLWMLEGHGLMLMTNIFNSDGDYTRLPKDNEDVSFHLGRLYFAFAAGYFIWDIVLCIRDFKRQGLAFTIHAFFGVFGILLPLIEKHSPGLIYYGCAIFIMELSTPFLNLRSFLFIWKHEKTTIYWINNLAFAFFFFISRIIFGFFVNLSFAAFIISLNLDPLRTALWALGGIASNMLNVMWFYKIISAVGRGGESKKGSSSTKKAD